MTANTMHYQPCPADDHSVGLLKHGSSSEDLSLARDKNTLVPGPGGLGTFHNPALPQGDTRERSDTYTREILRSGEWRVAICRDGIQWLLQQRRKPTSEGATVAWDNVGYLTTRAALVRLWRAHTGEDGVDLLAMLPERFYREVAHVSQERPDDCPFRRILALSHPFTDALQAAPACPALRHPPGGPSGSPAPGDDHRWGHASFMTAAPVQISGA